MENWNKPSFQIRFGLSSSTHLWSVRRLIHAGSLVKGKRVQLARLEGYIMQIVGASWQRIRSFLCACFSRARYTSSALASPPTTDNYYYHTIERLNFKNGPFFAILNVLIRELWIFNRRHREQRRGIIKSFIHFSTK